MTTDQMPLWEWGYQIKGGIIRQRVRENLLEQYQDELSAKRLRVEILRFAPPAYEGVPTERQQLELARYTAAADSTRVKLSAFDRLLVEAVEREPLPQDMTRAAFERLIQQLNNDSSINVIIVQYPVPPELVGVLPSISPQKDLDALSNPPAFATPATAEGIFRVVRPFTEGQYSIDIQSEAIVRLLEPFANDATVAVVGARGFVGSGVVHLLEEEGISCITIDRRDADFQAEDLLQVREADIVVSATGVPSILDERHITPYHRLVVDCGYVPLGDHRFGDIARSAYAIPQNITPVPGGTGPIEMAVLMERLIRKEIDPNVEQWRLESYQPVNYFPRQTLEQLQQQWATDIFPVAQQLIVGFREKVQEISPNLLLLEGQFYNLTFNREENTLSLQSNSIRGELAKFSLTGEVQFAAGLTENDYQLWQSIERTIDQWDRGSPDIKHDR